MLAEPNQPGAAAVIDNHRVTFAARMVWGPNWFVEPLKRVPATLDGHFFLPLGAALSWDRFFKTGLPVLSDLIAMTGSPLAPRRVTVPPVGPLTL